MQNEEMIYGVLPPHNKQESREFISLEDWQKINKYVVSNPIGKNDATIIDQLTDKFSIPKSGTKSIFREKTKDVVNELIAECNALNDKLTAYYTKPSSISDVENIMIELFSFGNKISQLSSKQTGFDIDNLDDHATAVSVVGKCFDANSTIKKLFDLELNLRNPNRNDKVNIQAPITALEFSQKNKVFSLYQLVADQLAGYAGLNYAKLGIGSKDNTYILKRAEKSVKAFVEATNHKSGGLEDIMIGFLELLKVNEPLGFSPYFISSDPNYNAVIDCVNAIHFDKEKADKMAENAVNLANQIAESNRLAKEAQKQGKEAKFVHYENPMDVVLSLILQASGYDITPAFENAIYSRYGQDRNRLKNDFVEIEPEIEIIDDKPEIDEPENKKQITPAPTEPTPPTPANFATKIEDVTPPSTDTSKIETNDVKPDAIETEQDFCEKTSDADETIKQQEEDIKPENDIYVYESSDVTTLINGDDGIDFSGAPLNPPSATNKSELEIAFEQKIIEAAKKEEIATENGKSRRKRVKAEKYQGSNRKPIEKPEDVIAEEIAALKIDLTRYFEFDNCGFWSGIVQKYPAEAFNFAISESANQEKTDSYKAKALQFAGTHYSMAVTHLQKCIAETTNAEEKSAFETQLVDIETLFKLFELERFVPQVEIMNESEQEQTSLLAPESEKQEVPVEEEAFENEEEIKQTAPISEPMLFQNIIANLKYRIGMPYNSNFTPRNEEQMDIGLNRISLAECELANKLIDIAELHGISNKEHAFYRQIASDVSAAKAGPRRGKPNFGTKQIKLALEEFLPKYEDADYELSQEFKVLYNEVCNYLDVRWNETEQYIRETERKGEEPVYILGIKTRSREEYRIMDSYITDGMTKPADEKDPKAEPEADKENAETAEQTSEETKCEASSENEEASPCEAEPEGPEEPENSTEEASCSISDETDSTASTEEADTNEGDNKMIDNEIQTKNKESSELELYTKFNYQLIQRDLKSKKSKEQRMSVAHKPFMVLALKILDARNISIENRELYNDILKDEPYFITNEKPNLRLKKGPKSEYVLGFINVFETIQKYEENPELELPNELKVMLNTFFRCSDKWLDLPQTNDKLETKAEETQEALQTSEVSEEADDNSNTSKIADEQVCDNETNKEDDKTVAESETEEEAFEEDKTSEPAEIEEEKPIENEKPVSIWQMSLAGVNYFGEYYNLANLKKVEYINLAISVVNGISYDKKTIETEKRKLTSSEPTQISKEELLQEPTNLKEDHTSSGVVKQFVSYLDEIDDMFNYKNIGAIVFKLFGCSEDKVEYEGASVIFKDGTTINFE